MTLNRLNEIQNEIADAEYRYTSTYDQTHEPPLSQGERMRRLGIIFALRRAKNDLALVKRTLVEGEDL